VHIIFHPQTAAHLERCSIVCPFVSDALLRFVFCSFHIFI